MWASVVRGGARASVEGPIRQTPAVSTADFTALYEHCLASGLKARVVFSHITGLQIATVSCSLPTTVINDATAVNRRH
jgi:hypothetical protein